MQGTLSEVEDKVVATTSFVCVMKWLRRCALEFSHLWQRLDLLPHRMNARKDGGAFVCGHCNHYALCCFWGFGDKKKN